MTVTQLNPPIPLKTPKGNGLAHFVIDYGPEHNLLWTVFIDETGECWTFSNRDIRATDNLTMGRMPARRLEKKSSGHDVINGANGISHVAKAKL